MKIVILDYTEGSVYITKIPNNLDGEELNRYVEEELGYRLDDIEFMTSKDLNVKINL